MAIVTESIEAMKRINKLEVENSELKKEITQLKSTLHKQDHNSFEFTEDIVKEESDRDSMRLWKMTIAPEERANIPAFFDTQAFRMPGRAFNKFHENKENISEFAVVQMIRKQLEDLLTKLKDIMEEEIPTIRNHKWAEGNTNIVKNEWKPIKKFPFKRKQKEVLSVQNPNASSYVSAQVENKRYNFQIYKLSNESLTRQKATP